MAADEFLRVQRDLTEAFRTRPAAPKGWEPGIDTARGTLTVEGGSEPPQDWAAIIRELGLDPADWTVDESQPVQVRTWDSGDRRCYYYRATVKPAGSRESADLDALIARVRRHKKSPPAASERPERAFLVLLSDWQAGKGEGGGYEALVERVERLREAVPRRVRELARIGAPVDRIYVMSLGDLVESCDGHYPMQSFSVDLDRRQQVKLVRRLLVDLITHWSSLAPRIVLGAVPGNHGENRQGGKAYTSFEDNDDLAVVEQVGEILAANPDAYGHVSVVIPDGDMTLTLDLAGCIAAFAHGHQARRGTGVSGKILSWWRDKAQAFHPVGDARLLFTGHYHHYVAVEDGPRTWMQCPALDGGSRWFEEQGGPTTRTGTLTMTVDQSGWDHLAILR